MHKTEAKDKILIIFTGGTIGSTCKEGVIDVDETNSLLLQMYQEKYAPLHVKFTTLTALNILSENLEVSHMQTVVDVIDEHKNAYDGIVLTHGTDTLAFMSALLSRYYFDTTIPIFLVSSQYPLENPQANGLTNLHCALRYMQEKLPSGVFVAYQNESEECKVHQGHQLTQSFQMSARFESLNNKSYMHYSNNKFTLITPYKKVTNSNKKVPLRADIMLIYPYPSINYTLFVLRTNKRVLLSTYHSGTLDTNALRFLHTCKKKKVPVYICGIPTQDAYYASTKALINSGATILYDMSVENAYANLVLNREAT